MARLYSPAENRFNKTRIRLSAVMEIRQKVKPSPLPLYILNTRLTVELAWVVNGEVLCILQFIPAFFCSKDVLF